MISYLILLILVLSLAQDGKGRIAALVFAIVCGGHSVLFGGLEGTAYFLSAAAADVIIVCFLCFKVPVSRLSDLLISISLLFWSVNSVGWLMWYFGQPIEPYYYSCLTLYLLTILSLLRKDGACESGINIFNSCFRYLGRPGYALRSVLRQASQ